MIFRRETRSAQFTTVDNEFIRDINISFKAKGILLYMLSRPDNWTFYESEIANNTSDGVKSIKSGIKELIEFGYVERHQLKKDNKFNGYEYIIHEKSPLCRFRTTGNRTTQNGTLVNTDSTQTDSINLHQTPFDDIYIGDDLHHSATQPDAIPISTKVTKRKDDGYYDLKAIKDKYFEPELLPYIDCYLNAQASYRRVNGQSLYIKRISKDNLARVYGEITDLVGDGIDIEDWKESVQEHFDNLPKGNDGDILAFLEASRRYFG